MSETTKPSGGAEPLWSTYLHRKGGALGLPIAGNFELTTRCNFRCKMCYIHDNANLSELTAQEWIRLGREARDRGMVFLLLTGGEPFVRQDFREIYTGLKQLGLLISINTNGSLLTDEDIRFLVSDPPLRMNISLYGTSNHTYSRLCGRPGCDAVCRNIRKLHEAGIQIRVNASVTPENAADIPAMYRFAEKVGVPIKATTYMFPPVRVNGCQFGEAPYRFTPEEAALYMLLCREQYLSREQLAASVTMPLPPEQSECSDGQGEPMRCRAGRTSFWVTWDGRMLPCGMFPTKGISIREKGFDAAWEAVRSMTAAMRLPPECTDCPHKDQCPACAAACVCESGDSRICPDYICRMTKELHRLTKEKYAIPPSNQ